MFRRFFTLFIALLVIGLACNAPVEMIPKSADATDDPGEGGLPSSETIKTNVTEISISPASGKPNQSLAVHVRYERGAPPPDPVICAYPDQNGNETQSQHTVNPPDQKTGESFDSWDFSISVSQPGTYPISCWGAATSKMTSFFTIRDAGQAADTVEPANFTKATLTIQWAKVVATEGDTVNIYSCREVQVVVSAEGGLSGACQASPASSDQSPVSGNLSGKWNRDTGDVTFHLESQMTVTGSPDTSKQAHWAVTVNTGAPGRFVSDAQAEGEANWTNTCDAHPDISCYDLTTHKHAAGTVPWVMVFQK